ncbi:MAG: hypothetical protein JRG74_03405 [Deltaproteobacteria bacterium]|nr:hypothetical protein [Deltaproteobacteria bacterium]MBW2165164.1 hypothetical protein [Deltaproteobacteria bacterium]
MEYNTTLKVAAEIINLLKSKRSTLGDAHKITSLVTNIINKKIINAEECLQSTTLEMKLEDS